MNRDEPSSASSRGVSVHPFGLEGRMFRLQSNETARSAQIRLNAHTGIFADFDCSRNLAPRGKIHHHHHHIIIIIVNQSCQSIASIDASIAHFRVASSSSNVGSRTHARRRSPWATPSTDGSTYFLTRRSWIHPRRRDVVVRPRGRCGPRALILDADRLDASNDAEEPISPQ